MGERFGFKDSGLIWSHFHSLANLLSLRNGGQIEPASSSIEPLDGEWDSNDNGYSDTSSEDTRCAHISDAADEAERLKRRFLDCLAEFAANKKGGKAVACSAMRECEDNVSIWITRNEGFDAGDKYTFDILGDLLASLSFETADQSDSLWRMMIAYHSNRIETSYIPDLRSNFKAYDAVSGKSHTVQNSPDIEYHIADLRGLLFGHTGTGISALERFQSLVTAAYKLRQNKVVKEFLCSSMGATSKSKSLWVNICMLARLRVAFEIFKDIALTHSSFKHVAITLVPGPPKPDRHPMGDLNFRQTFGLLHLDPSPATIKTVLGRNSTVAKMEREFDKRQKQKPRIHAEVQMLMFLCASEELTSEIVPYFGCSKLCCFMCARLIQSYGRISTRGCHGRLFKPWTISSPSQLPNNQAQRVTRALVLVQQEVRKELGCPKCDLQHERTSVIGGSSVFGTQKGMITQRTNQISRLRMKAERDRVVELFRRQTEGARVPPTFLDPPTADLELDCNICMTPTKRRCTICNSDRFCSEACQERRSGSHLFTCTKRPLTTADYFWQSLAEDLIPEDKDVLDDFGFSNTFHSDERIKLFGLFRGLYLDGDISAEDLHKWRIGGVLIEKIKEYYYQIPEESRGRYFPWFLNNLHLLERPMSKDEVEENFITSFHDKARPYLEVEDRHKSPRELANMEPQAKRESFHLLTEMLHKMRPHPMELVWYEFGYVTCRDEEEEKLLFGIYELLFTGGEGHFFYRFPGQRRGPFEPVTFTQFWKAYEARTLIPLIDSKGLKTVRSSLPFLEDFMSDSPNEFRTSVWDLKQFLKVADPLDFPPVNTIRVDYGFANCETFEDTCILMEIYGQVLQRASPLDLHRACIAGELFQFSSRFVKLEKRWKHLMKNVYPLKESYGPEIGVEDKAKMDGESKSEPSWLTSLASRLFWGNPVGGAPHP